MNFELLFKTNMTFNVGPGPNDIAIADLNLDRHADIVIANQGYFGANSTISVLMSDNYGSFAPQTTFEVGSHPLSIAVENLDHDIYPDIVVANNGANAGTTISVLFGYGNGNFSNQTLLTVGVGPCSIAVGDVNLDTYFDILVLNCGNVVSTSTISVLFGYGNGSFSSQTVVFLGDGEIYGAIYLVIADLNNDTYSDIVVSIFPGTVLVLNGYSNGSFATPAQFSVGYAPDFLAIADLNQDRKLDIVVTNFGSNTVSVLIGYGNSSFAPQKIFTVGIGPFGIALDDLNKDTYLDIVVSNTHNNTISILIGYGNGTFANQTVFAVGSSPKGIAIKDLNQDTYLDVVVTNHEDNTILALLGNPDAYIASSSTLSFTPTLKPIPIPVHSTTTQTLSFTQTILAQSRLVPINNIYSPQGPISIISQFDPEKDKINLAAYPGVTYPDLRFEQAENNTMIRFTYPAFFLFSASLPPGQTLTTNNLLCAPSTQTRYGLVQSDALTPTNGTTLTQFDPRQDQIDLRRYNISCSSIQIQVVYNLTVIQFHYPQPAHITVSNTKPSDLSQDHFIFATSPLETSIDKIIRWAKVLAGPVASAFSTAIGLYLKRGLVHNIVFASGCWKGNRYIKDEVWAPSDTDEARELTDRHGKPISMRHVKSITLFTVFKEEPPSLFTRILPNYYALDKQSELIDHKLVMLQPVSNNAWVKLNPSTFEGQKIDAFFIQVLAKNGAILEQFESSLANLNSEYGAFSLDMSGAPEEEGSATASGSENPSSFDADQSKTVLSSVYCVQIQWSNPILQNYPLLQLAYRTGGPAGVDRLINLGTDSHRYGEFEHLEQMMGTQKALEWMLGSDAKPVSTVGSSSAHPVSPSNLFWVGMIAYRLPVAYDQTHYLLKTTGLDLDEFYEDQGLTTFVNPIGSILRPSLLLGGATLAYCTSSDPLVLLVAANQPGFSGHSDLLSDSIHYLATILSFARAYAYPSAYTLPLIALQSTSLLSHVLVDTGLVAEDNHLMQFMQSVTGLASETLGLFLYPDLPIKALQGISLLAQSLHCAELAGEDILSYLPYSTHTDIEATTETSSTEATAIEDLVAFS